MDETDFKRMLEQAQTLSAIFGGGQNSIDASDIDRLKNVMEIMDGFSASQDRETVSTEEVYAESGIQAIKAAIPHLDRRYQRITLLFIKVIEIHRLLDIYSRLASETGSMTADWRREMLMAFKPYISPDKCSMIELMISLMDVKKILYESEVMRYGQH